MAEYLGFSSSIFPFPNSATKKKDEHVNFFFFCYLSSTHGNGGGGNHTHFFLSSFTFPFLFYPFSHKPLAQHVLWHVLPITLCHGWPLVIKWGKLTCKSTPLITCTNRSLWINLSHFKSVTHKSYWLNSHAIY